MKKQTEKDRNVYNFHLPDPIWVFGTFCETVFDGLKQTHHSLVSHLRHLFGMLAQRRAQNTAADDVVEAILIQLEAIRGNSHLNVRNNKTTESHADFLEFLLVNEGVLPAA